MAEHLLHGAQVGATFDQVGGKGMAQGVRTDRFPDACLLRKAFYDIEHHNPCQLFAPAAQEYEIFLPFQDPDMDAHLPQVSPELLQGAVAHRHQPLLVALAYHGDEAVVEPDFGDFQVDQLADPQSTAIQHLQHGLVPLPFRAAQVNGGKEFFHLVHPQGVRQSPAQPGRFQQLRRVGTDHVLQQ